MTTISQQILIKRGNTNVASTYTGPSGELIIDTGLKTIRVQDGAIPGGHLILSEGQTGNLTNLNVSGNISTMGYYFGNGAQLTNVNITPQFASSLTTNGYQKLPGGLILQWGTTTSVGTNIGNANTVLPITFLTAFLNGTASILDSSSNNYTVQVGASSSANTIVLTTLLGNVITSGIGVNFTAIGY